MKDYKAEYQRNKLYYRERDRKRVAKLREVLNEAKAKPCMDCGVSYPPYVMDFDHVRGEKVRNVAKLSQFSSEVKLLEEIAKCDLVCSNCHRERTWQRKQE